MRAAMGDSIDALAADAIDACGRSWPGVRIATDVVRARVARLDPATIDPQRLGELCLVWACVAGDTAAQRAIDAIIRAEAQRVVRELRGEPWLVDEVHQELSQRLLVASSGKEPRLATYAGQAVLGRWLGVAAMRTALNLTRRKKLHTPVDDHPDLAAALVDPELRVVRDRFKADVEYAIRLAFASLDDPRDRNLLRLYYIDKLPLDRLGQMFGVHASTVSRWLTALREAIFLVTRDRLTERLGLRGDAASIESLIRAVQSELDLTLTQILGTNP
jgi:RNA polymerase sigma-70 factor, ECF subfamily